MLRLSERTAFDGRPNVLARALAERRPELDLTVSNPTRVGLEYPAEAILAALADPRALRYEPLPFGLPAARAAAAAVMGGAPERTVLAASTSEAYGWLFKLLCDPGDEVLCPSPSYPLFAHLAAFEGVRLRPYRLAYDGAWHVDLDSVRPTPRTRAILVVSPNNPTGSYATAGELEALAARGLPLVVDEVFAPYRLVEGGAPRALEAPGTVFALGGLSKQAGLPQMKAGWVSVGGPGAEDVLARLELVADTWLSVGAPVQHALPALLASSVEGRILDRVRGNLGRLRAALAGSAVEVLRVEGGWSAVLRLPGTRSEEAWVVGLLREQGVLVQPGWFYDFEGGPYAVVSLPTPPGVLDEGLRRVRGCCDS